ncbi:MAG: 4-carboxymuconolactone decarboxylase [Rhodospirillaceae bacterium]|nr:4-carboxymuconolactone decarboxylase [Rhodospirillaceae bacterium]
MSKTDLYKKGDAKRREMYGEAAYNRANETVYSDPIMRQFLDVTTETVFGALWARPGLDTKTRALICVVSDIATQREDELAIHLRFAIGQGWTEGELIETMLHLSGYIGVPSVRGAMLVAKRVFAELREEAG